MKRETSLSQRFSEKRIALTLFSLLLLAPLSSIRGEEKPAKPAVEISIPFEITATGHQAVTLMYGEKKIRMILDTAAGANVFSREAIEKMGVETKDSLETVSGLGTAAQDTTEVPPLTLVYGETKLPIENAISIDLSHVKAAGGEEGLDGLLGSPFFKLYKAKIDFSTRKLVLSIDASQDQSSTRKRGCSFCFPFSAIS